MLEKPGLSPEMLRLVRAALVLFGGALAWFAHSKLGIALSSKWTNDAEINRELLQSVGEVGALFGGSQLLSRLGDISKTSALLSIFQSTMRPPAPPSPPPPPPAER